jgi:hypothetical protein
LDGVTGFGKHRHVATHGAPCAATYQICCTRAVAIVGDIDKGWHREAATHCTTSFAVRNSNAGFEAAPDACVTVTDSTVLLIKRKGIKKMATL